MEGGQLPHVTPGLVYAAALPPADEDAGNLCRICFGPDESEASGNPADQFISPCKCSGEP
jgi:RING-variant domain